MRMRLPIAAFALQHSIKHSGRTGSTFLTSAQEIVTPKTQTSSTSPHYAKTELNMGMGKAAAEVVLKDYSGAIGGFFGGVRIPASLITGASLGALFTMTGRLKDKSVLTKTELVLVKVYNALVLVSFVLSLSTVVFATAANTAVLHGGFDPMAKSAYELLVRQFHYDFVATRLGFLVALVTFIKAVFIRTIIEFDLVKADSHHGLICVSLIGVSLACHLLSYINSTLFCWGNLFPMMVHFMKVSSHLS